MAIICPNCDIPINLGVRTCLKCGLTAMEIALGKTKHEPEKKVKKLAMTDLLRDLEKSINVKERVTQQINKSVNLASPSPGPGIDPWARRAYIGEALSGSFSDVSGSLSGSMSPEPSESVSPSATISLSATISPSQAASLEFNDEDD